MLQEFVDDYVESNNVVVTSSSGGGATSLCLFIANTLLNQNKFILYFNPQNNIEQSFVKKFYPRVYSDVVFAACCVEQLIYMLQYLDYTVDYLILDPADCLLCTPNLIPAIKKLLKGKIICSSQIRQDPSKGGQIYSTIEKKYNELFDYSIWIRNVTEQTYLYKRKYIDIFEKIRTGNNYKSRYIANFTNEGNIIG